MTLTNTETAEANRDEAIEQSKAVLSKIREQGWEGADVVTLLSEFLIEARHAERQRNQWQPIETAPKDGSPILAYNTVIGIYNTAYQASEPDEGDRFPCGFAGWLGKWFCRPTHWMPLPAPPVEAK